mmetsp:Transcript_22918/g.48496  ORF Transcript_22918/g.48496 Transcript_22918/m.48496 type:complete len:632 (+) Transcript_22918:165-2060(+)
MSIETDVTRPLLSSSSPTDSPSTETANGTANGLRRRSKQLEGSPFVRENGVDGGSMASSSALVRNVKKLTRRKRVEDIISDSILEHSSGEGLKRSLTALDLIAYGIGATVGAGLFVVTGEAAKNLAGPAVSISFLLAALSGLLSAFCYAEFSTRIPVAGGAYAYSYVCFGEAVAWLVGWNLTLEYGMSASVVARGFSDYFVAFLKSTGLNPPYWLYDIPLDVSFLSKHGSLLASGVVLVCTACLLLGASESARLNVAITFLNLGLILFIIVAGVSEVDSENYEPFFPYGSNGIVSGAGFVFFSYVGFDCICVLSEELKNPTRDLPIAIVGTLFIVSALYVTVSLILTGMVKYTEIDLSAPLSNAFMQLNMPWAAIVVAFGTTTILTSTTLCSLFGQPRVFFAMAKDGLVPQKLAELNQKTKVPAFSTYLSGIISAVLAFCLDIDSLAGMISAGTMLSFTLVSMGILVVRYEDAPDSKKVDARFYERYSFWLTLFCVMCVALNVVMIHFPLTPIMWQATCGALTLAPICVLACLPQNPIKRAVPQDLMTVNGSEQEELAEEGRDVFAGDVFKCPWVPWIPAFAAVINMHLILSLDAGTLIRLGVWSALGYLFYFSYGFKNSRLNSHSPYHRL